MEIRIFVTHGKNTKIKKERLTKLVREILFTLVAIFLLSGETSGASSASHYSKNTSENQRQKVQKQNRKTAKTLSSNKVNNPDKQFARTVSLSGLTPDTPFGEAIDIFRNSTEPPLNIVVFWRDLEENSDVDRYTPIGIEPLSGVSLGQNLELILMSVSSDPRKLGYAVEKGVIIIATKDFLPTKMISRIYDVTDLASVPANYFSPGLTGPMGYYGIPSGATGYGGYGRPYSQAYGRAYGAGSNGRAYGLGGYSRYPYSVRGSELRDLIGTFHGPIRRTR
jgi:hypothetical protein